MKWGDIFVLNHILH